jgi:2-iminobutanoate/2-iminopropanoate deaminase
MASKRVRSSDRIPPAVGPYSQAVQYGDLVFCSGIVPLDPEDGGIVEGGIQEQTRRVLDNLMLLLEDLGSGAEMVLKTTVFLADMETFGAFNEVYETYFPADPPARSTVEAARLPLDVLIEVEAIAAIEHD